MAVSAACIKNCWMHSHDLVSARLSVFAAIVQGAPDGRTDARACARAGVSLSAIAGFAGSSNPLGARYCQPIDAARIDHHRLLAGRLLRHLAGRAAWLPCGIAEPCDQAAARPGVVCRCDYPLPFG